MNTKENVAAEAKTSEKLVLNVVKVMLPEGGDNRITLVTDNEFETVDFTTGETKPTNMFGLNIYNLVTMVANDVPQIQMADALALGKMVNPQIISLALTNATLTCVREAHSAGDKREDGESEYSKDCIVTKILGVKTNIKPAFAAMLDRLVMTNPCVVKVTTTNPFNI
jgi:hypothetical protein